jgi:DNA-binding response OmpR family regulator
MHILLAEDEPKIAAFIQKGLEENGYNLSIAYDGKTALQQALQEKYDLIILDVMLPLISGLQICERIRGAGIETPVLILTALGSVEDKVKGLQQGADDYLVKPFHFKELIARIQALARRQTQPAKENELHIADLTMNRSRKTVTRDSREIVLTAKEYALLEMFMQHVNHVLSRNDIAEQVWGNDFDTNSNVVDVYINYLRKKIEKGFSSRLIHTVVGMGYVMKE